MQTDVMLTNQFRAKTNFGSQNIYIYIYIYICAKTIAYIIMLFKHLIAYIIMLFLLYNRIPYFKEMIIQRKS